MKLNNAENYESLMVTLNKNDHPIAFANRIQDLMNSGFTIEECEKLVCEPIELELYYDPEYGLFAVDSGAVEAGTIYNPYNRKELELADEGNE